MRPDRRTFLQRWAALALGLAGRTVAGWEAEGGAMAKPTSEGVTLFLCGDLMLGRGIDQVLPSPGDPQLYEPYVHSALGYLALAERVNGPIPRPVDLAYVWGDALEELARRHPSLCIVNLETAVTAGGEPWPGKGIHYRLHPGNAPCLKAARVDCSTGATRDSMKRWWRCAGWASRRPGPGATWRRPRPRPCGRSPAAVAS